MKKKGLIISTVVMVVVLIASLTTATYAWFSTSAQAAVEDLQVVTKAAEGLQIALYDATAASWSTGAATLTGDRWKGGVTGWSAAVNFDANKGKPYMGVSGDGFKMFMLDGEEAADEDGKPVDKTNVKAATANTDYFVAFLGLQNTMDDARKIQLKDITITPQANSAELVGMAAALRIAIFATTDKDVAISDLSKANTEEGQGKVWKTADAKFVFDPYGDLEYASASGAWSTPGLPDSSTVADPKYLTATGEYTTVSASKAGGLKTTYATAYKRGKIETAANGPEELTYDTAVDLADNVAGGGKGVVYLMVVIWFEGEDAECITRFAGGGAIVSMNFTHTEAGA